MDNLEVKTRKVDLKGWLIKTKEVLAKGLGALRNAFFSTRRFFKRLSETKTYRVSCKILIALLIILAFVQFAFGVLIYGFAGKEYSDKSIFKFLYVASNSQVTTYVGKIVPYPIAVVNYDFVTYRDFLNEQSYIHHFYSATKQEDIDFKGIDRQIIDQLIDNKIIVMESYLYKVHVQKSDIDSTIDSIIQQNGGQSQVEKVLHDLYNLSLRDFRRLVETQILRDKIDQKVIARVGVRHILIRVETGATQEQVDAAKVKIDGVLAEIKAGADFSAEAIKYSEDTGSAAQGGKLDPFAKGEMVDEFSNVAFNTPVGQISDPVRTEFGWHIILVESKTGSVNDTFANWVLGIREKSLVLKLFSF